MRSPAEEESPTGPYDNAQLGMTAGNPFMDPNDRADQLTGNPWEMPGPQANIRDLPFAGNTDWAKDLLGTLNSGQNYDYGVPDVGFGGIPNSILQNIAPEVAAPTMVGAYPATSGALNPQTDPGTGGFYGAAMTPDQSQLQATQQASSNLDTFTEAGIPITPPPTIPDSMQPSQDQVDMWSQPQTTPPVMQDYSDPNSSAYGTMAPQYIDRPVAPPPNYDPYSAGFAGVGGDNLGATIYAPNFTVGNVPPPDPSNYGTAGLMAGMTGNPVLDYYTPTLNAASIHGTQQLYNNAMNVYNTGQSQLGIYGGGAYNMGYGIY